MSKRLLTAVAVFALAVSGVFLGAAPAAIAADGSIPVQVSTFISGQLQAKLSDLYGPNGAGKGYRFDRSTTFTATSRVFEFAPHFRSAPATPAPTDTIVAARRINQWVTVVTLGKVVIGVARIGYSTSNGAALIDFAPDTTLAAALPALAPTAQLVHDSAHRAWGSVVGNTFTPIEAGSSKLDAPTRLADYPAAPKVASAVTSIDPGVAAGAGTLILAIIVIALMLLLPQRKRGTLA